MVAWPSTLPQTFSGSNTYQETPQNVVLRSTMDLGITKVRRRQTRSESKVSGVLILNELQTSQFSIFFSETLKGGSIPFSGHLTREGVTQNYIFAEEPSISHVGGNYYEVSMTLIILPT